MRRQEKAKQALGRKRATPSSLLNHYENRYKCSPLTCPGVEASAGHICPWRCPWAGWWQTGGRTLRWRPGSASHPGPCRWASYSSPSTPRSCLQKSLRHWGRMSFLDEEQMDEDLSESVTLLEHSSIFYFPHVWDWVMGAAAYTWTDEFVLGAELLSQPTH